MTIYDFRDSVYKSTDFADNYTIIGGPSSFTGDIREAAIAENNSDIIVIARYEDIDKSTDGGITFNSIKNNLPNYSIEDIAFDPNDDNTMIVVYGRYQNDNSKVFITTNGGTSWTNITHNLGNMPIRSVVIDHTTDRNIYLGAEIGIYTKPMSGNTWTPYNSNLPNTSIYEMEINHGSNTIKAATWGRGLWEYALVGRSDYPAFVHTTISNPPTESTPKESIDQYVTSRISYDYSLTTVYLEWSANAPTFGNSISMSNISDSTWQSDTPLPDYPAGTKMYFKVFAVGSLNDTTETYHFMYTQRPFEYCNASGSTSAGNLYISNVNLESINNTTGNDTFTIYQNPIPTLYVDTTYNIFLSGNTGWSSNDYGVWIDYNNDAEFSSNEQVLLSVGSGSSANSSFTIPPAISTDDTVRMRVRLSYWGSTPSPCGTTFGEVEDYLVVLKDLTPIPTAPTVSITQPVCTNTNGTITITAPLGAGLEYSIDGSNYQSSPVFNAPPGVYGITARVIANPNLLGPPTIDSILSTTVPCGPNITTGALSSPSSIAEGASCAFDYFVSNIGTDPSTGAINILITKPTNGTLTLNLPTGWNIVSNTSSSVFLQSTNVIMPGLINRVTIPAIYVHDNTNEDAVKSTDISAAQGSAVS